jgi:hypothetical protein
MRLSNVIISALGVSSAVNAAVMPEQQANSLSIRSNSDIANTLEKRKGGGGGGRGGGGSGSSSGSSSGGRSGSSGSTSSSGSSGSSSGGGGGRGYGGGNYYAGGASTPYRSGGRSPGGIAPFVLGGAALGIGAYALYGAGAYAYPYAHPYYFHNRTEQAVNQTYTIDSNSSIPVQCVCTKDSNCGCEDQTDDSYISSIIGNGSASDMDPSVARVANVNGTDTLIINGTIPAGATSAAASLRVPEVAGMWMIAAGVGAFVYAL